MAQRVRIDLGFTPDYGGSKVAEKQGKQSAIDEVLRALNQWAYTGDPPKRRSRRRIRRRRA